MMQSLRPAAVAGGAPVPVSRAAQVALTLIAAAAHSGRPRLRRTPPVCLGTLDRRPFAQHTVRTHLFPDSVPTRSLSEEEPMGPVTRRQFLTTTGPASPASSPPASRPPGASSARSRTSAGTTSRPPRTRSWPRSASASPRTPASSSRSTTSRTWARSRPSTPPRCRRRPATTSSRCACTSRGSTSRSSSTSPTWWPGSRRSTARPSPPSYEGGARQGGLARGAAVPRHVRGRPIARISSRRRASRSPTPGRISTRSARSSRRWGTRSGSPSPELRLDLHGGARAVVVRRHGGGQGRQDRADQLARHRADDRVVPEDVQATAWSPRCCPGRTPATTSRSSRARRAGSTTRSAPTSSPSSASS